MSDYRTVDCEVWARRFLHVLHSRNLVAAMAIEIRPKPPARVIGGVRMPPNLQMVWPSPPWHHHFAVLNAGQMYDEMFPQGLTEEEYKNRFEHRDVLQFLEHPDFS